MSSFRNCPNVSAHGVNNRKEPAGEKIMRGQGERRGDVWFQEKDSQADRAEGRKMKTHQPGWAPHRSWKPQTLSTKS